MTTTGYRLIKQLADFSASISTWCRERTIVALINYNSLREKSIYVCVCGSARWVKCDANRTECCRIVTLVYVSIPKQRAACVLYMIVSVGRFSIHLRQIKLSVATAEAPAHFTYLYSYRWGACMHRAWECVSVCLQGTYGLWSDRCDVRECRSIRRYMLGCLAI